MVPPRRQYPEAIWMKGAQGMQRRNSQVSPDCTSIAIVRRAEMLAMIAVCDRAVIG